MSASLVSRSPRITMPERRIQPPPPSFAIATYNGRSRGHSTQWVCFLGIFTIEMNESMVKLLIDAIDNGPKGEDGDVELENEVYDLVEGLDELREEKARDAKAVPPERCNDSFSWSRFDTVFTIKCRLEGLNMLRQAVVDGADLENPSLYAFVAETNNVRKAWQDSMAERMRAS